MAPWRKRRPVQSEGLETREGNMITLGFAAVIALSFLPFAHVIFVPLLVLLALWVLGKGAHLSYICATVDERVAFGPLSRHEREEQEASILAAIREGHVRVGDEVADGIVITSALVAKAHEQIEEGQR